MALGITGIVVSLALLIFLAYRGWNVIMIAPFCAAVALLFRPDYFMNLITPEYQDLPPSQLMDMARDQPDGGRVVMVIAGSTIEGDEVVKTVAVRLADRPAENVDGRKRLSEAGLTLVALGGQVQIAQVKFGSRAQKSGFEQGWNVQTLKVPAERPNPHWFYLPALLLAGLVWWTQGRRLAR